MKSEEIRRKFLEFFETRDHKVVPSSSLIPDDPSVLLTTAGMQQFKRYFTGELDPIKDFGSRNTVSIQKSFRTSDIDEVGDETHLTFFEMLGHFSFGGYFKKETIEWTYQLLTEVFGIQPERISVTVFAGDDAVLFDQESFESWSRLLPKERIRKGPRQDNFWGPVGNEGPCGACNEVYVDNVEVATLVFMEYYCNPDKSLKSLSKKGVDVGWGFERLVFILQGAGNVFGTDIFKSLIDLLSPKMDERTKRIFVDHSRGIAFLISDGVRPSNKEAGYVLRRLMRRVIVYGSDSNWDGLFDAVCAHYGKFYPELKSDLIQSVFGEEKSKFEKTLKIGLKELERLQKIDAKSAFKLYESFGLPFEIIKERGGAKAKNLTRESFDEEFKKHQEISRAGKESKFGGHGVYLKTGEVTVKDKSELERVTRLHTATHLMHAALREVLGLEVRQNGSDITVERTRFDFNFPRKVAPEELKKVETLVNEAIKKDLSVSFIEMPKAEAEKTGALYFFKERYPDRVKVYYMGKTLESAFSKEFCGGPHVTHTGEVGKFKIVKEEAVGAGVRRIRGIVEP
ncbi:MAG TPA: alanine--tRNA ligase-related protein [Candidatus Paceibacterota bacterium]